MPQFIDRSRFLVFSTWRTLVQDVYSSLVVLDLPSLPLDQSQRSERWAIRHGRDRNLSVMLLIVTHAGPEGDIVELAVRADVVNHPL
jgi:hypothetical protein